MTTWNLRQGGDLEASWSAWSNKDQNGGLEEGVKPYTGQSIWGVDVYNARFNAAATLATVGPGLLEDGIEGLLGNIRNIFVRQGGADAESGEMTLVGAPSTEPAAVAVVEGGIPEIEALAEPPRIDPSELWGACFLPGTLIHTQQGTKPIEQIEPGDWVAARNQYSKQSQWRSVLQVFASQDKEIVRVQVQHADGMRETISATTEHPFYVTGNGWTGANALKAGDSLELLDGQRSLVLGVDPVEGRHVVHNFEVADDHTYFVGSRGIWVHNTSSVYDALKGGGEVADTAGAGPLTSGGQANTATGSQLNSQLIGEEVASGHAFDKHVVEGGEFADLGVSTRQQYANFVEDIVDNPATPTRYASDGTTYYLDEPTQTIVIRGQRGEATAFRPEYGVGWDNYLNTQVPRNVNVPAFDPVQNGRY
jgi:Pretoxin HINT domain